MILTAIKTMILQRVIGMWIFFKEKWAFFGFSAGTGNILSNVADYWVGIAITIPVGLLSIAAGIQKYGENKAKRKKAEMDNKKAEIEQEMAALQLVQLKKDIEEKTEEKRKEKESEATIVANTPKL